MQKKVNNRKHHSIKPMLVARVIIFQNVLLCDILTRGVYFH